MITKLIFYDYKKNGIEVVTDIKALESAKELTINFYSSIIKNGDKFFTDTNGLDIHPRILYQNSLFGSSPCTSPGCNYYPVTAMIYLTDALTDYYHLVLILKYILN